jgi:hypothetical protein
MIGRVLESAGPHPIERRDQLKTAGLKKQLSVDRISLCTRTRLVEAGGPGSARQRAKYLSSPTRIAALESPETHGITEAFLQHVAAIKRYKSAYAWNGLRLLG